MLYIYRIMNILSLLAGIWRVLETSTILIKSNRARGMLLMLHERW